VSRSCPALPTINTAAKRRCSDTAVLDEVETLDTRYGREYVKRPGLDRPSQRAVVIEQTLHAPVIVLIGVDTLLMFNFHHFPARDVEFEPVAEFEPVVEFEPVAESEPVAAVLDSILYSSHGVILGIQDVPPFARVKNEPEQVPSHGILLRMGCNTNPYIR